VIQLGSRVTLTSKHSVGVTTALLEDFGRSARRLTESIPVLVHLARRHPHMLDM